MSEVAVDHAPAEGTLAARDWCAIEAQLNARGNAVLPGVLDAAACASLTESYAHDEQFRSTVTMARHNFGRGEYRYFAYPLPALVARLRTAFYPPLAAIANRWQRLLGSARAYPATLTEYLAYCHERAQTRPTPLLLSYGCDDFNCLHQDLYGEEVFPLQVAIVLNAPGADFSGGEFVLTEQRPRMQSRVEVVPLERGDAVVFPVAVRPVRGARGCYRVNMRHGVSRVRGGKRMTLGLIFHDAK